jgi:hypothetical protein
MAFIQNREYVYIYIIFKIQYNVIYRDKNCWMEMPLQGPKKRNNARRATTRGLLQYLYRTHTSHSRLV